MEGVGSLSKKTERLLLFPLQRGTDLPNAHPAGACWVWGGELDLGAMQRSTTSLKLLNELGCTLATSNMKVESSTEATPPIGPCLRILHALEALKGSAKVDLVCMWLRMHVAEDVFLRASLIQHYVHIDYFGEQYKNSPLPWVTPRRMHCTLASPHDIRLFLAQTSSSLIGREEEQSTNDCIWIWRSLRQWLS